MKKHILVIAALAVLAQASLATAAVTSLTYKFDCPTNLSNLSSALNGIGSLQIGSGQTHKIQFEGSVPVGTPLDLSSFSNSNTKYDECTGKVSCQYHSSEGWPVIYLSYSPAQVKWGTVIKQTAKEINVKVPVGLAK